MAEYVDLLENNKRIKQLARAMSPRDKRNTRTPGLDKNQDWYHIEDTPWERDKNEDVPQVEYKEEAEHQGSEVACKNREDKYEVRKGRLKPWEYAAPDEDPESDSECDEAEYEEADYEDESEDEYGCDNEVANEEEDDEVKYILLVESSR